MKVFNQNMESGNAAAVFQRGKVQQLQALGEQTLVQAKFL
jgi:hypothetical protein